MITPGLNKTANDGINNAVNIRANKANAWHGKITPEGNIFEQFELMWYSYRAGIIILWNLYAQGKTTLNLIIATYAPASDGNTPVQYAATVAAAANISPDDSLAPYMHDKDTMSAIITAMAKVEQGASFEVNPDDVIAAWENLWL